MDKEPIGEGLTNAIWETEDGTVVKYIADSSWTVALINLLQIVFLNFDFLTKKQRLENELRAKRVLSRLEIPHPEILRHDTNFIEMEQIDGKPLLQYLASASPEECYAVGHAKGEELERLHDHGSAYVDCRCGNTLVTDEGLVSIDHELFREDASGFLKELDLVTLTASAKVLSEGKYAVFLEGLQEGYDGVFRIDKGFRAFFTGIGMLGYALVVKQSPTLVTRCWRNWRHDLTQHLGELPGRA